MGEGPEWHERQLLLLMMDVTVTEYVTPVVSQGPLTPYSSSSDLYSQLLRKTAAIIGNNKMILLLFAMRLDNKILDDGLFWGLYTEVEQYSCLEK